MVDLLITDYSSIVFEFSTLGRPMLFFAYDLEEYVAERDFYVPVRGSSCPAASCAPSRSCWTRSGATTTRSEKVDTFARRHFAHLDGSSTDRVIDELVLDLRP